LQSSAEQLKGFSCLSITFTVQLDRLQEKQPIESFVTLCSLLLRLVELEQDFSVRGEESIEGDDMLLAILATECIAEGISLGRVA
jgi:hypothetical protein